MPDAPDLDRVASDILVAATHEFAEHGLAGARVDAIAARTGTSKRMIYYHFGSKEGLYAAVLAHAYRDVRGQGFDAAMVEGVPALDALLALAAHAFDSHASHPEFVRLVMYENLQGGRTVAGLTDIAALNRDGLAQVAALLARGQAEGTVRADVAARDVYLLFIAQCFHHVSNRLSLGAVLGTDAAAAAEMDARRRAAVIESVRRFVQKSGD